LVSYFKALYFSASYVQLYPGQLMIAVSGWKFTRSAAQIVGHLRVAGVTKGYPVRCTWHGHEDTTFT